MFRPKIGVHHHHHSSTPVEPKWWDYLLRCVVQVRLKGGQESFTWKEIKDATNAQQTLGTQERRLQMLSFQDNPFTQLVTTPNVQR